MRVAWSRFAERIESLTLRERALVFAAGVAVVLFLAWVIALHPLSSQNARASARLRALGEEAAALEAQKAELASRVDAHPDEEIRARIAALDARLQALDGALETVRTGLIEPARMTGVIRGLLERHARLRLMDVRTLPATPFVGPHERDGAAPREAAESEAGIYKHGLEITLEGSYPDLLAYAAQLEGLPARVLWNRTRIDATAYPRVTMTLTLYTLSLERTWLTI